MITIDAQGRSLGRVASEAASQLMGKNSTVFVRHMAPTNPVRVINLSKMAIRPDRARATSHIRYTGFPGGLRSETIEHVIATKGYAEAFRRAVRGMLPNNKLRPGMLKLLVLED